MQYPPGPSDWCFGLNLIHQFGTDPLGYAARVQREYGDIVCSRMGPYLDYIFFHPDQVKELLVTRAKQTIRFPHAVQVLQQFNGQGLIVTEGELWRRQRRMLTPAFAPARLVSYSPAMIGHVTKLAEEWREKAKAAGGSHAVDIFAAMTQLTMRIFVDAMFGAEFHVDTTEIAKAVGILSQTTASEFSSPVILPDWLPLPGKAEKRWAIDVLDRTVRAFIRERRESGKERDDLIGMLFAAQDDEAGGAKFTDEELRDQVFTLFMAGFDTTAAGLAWTWYNLAKNPDALAPLQQELTTVAGDRELTHGDLAKLSYADGCVKESLRLYPPASATMARVNTEEIEIGGYTIPTGSLLHVFIFTTQRDPRWWPEPERFDPERFSPANSDDRPQFAYFPFGGGPRMCIGHGFASNEILIVVAILARYFDCVLAPGTAEPKLNAHMSLRPAEPIQVVFTPRA